MNCIAVDDEPLALKQLESYISRVPFLTLAKSCHSAGEALDEIAQSHIDLIFLDVKMPDMNGMNLAKSLPQPAPLIIFTTAYSDYAVEGFKVDAVDYLLKPFSFDEFIKSVNKARQMYEQRQPLQAGEAPKPDIKRDEEFLFVKSDYRIVRLNVADIRYIESMSEYVRIFLEGETKPVVTLVSMKKFEDLLPPDRFMRVHRSYLVNLTKIVEVQRMRILFDKNTYVPVGELYKAKFLEYIDKNFIGKN